MQELSNPEYNQFTETHFLIPETPRVDFVNRLIAADTEEENVYDHHNVLHAASQHVFFMTCQHGAIDIQREIYVAIDKYVISLF
jgi:hypothetical protein